eukprot:g2210.t1
MVQAHQQCTTPQRVVLVPAKSGADAAPDRRQRPRLPQPATGRQQVSATHRKAGHDPHPIRYCSGHGNFRTCSTTGQRWTGYLVLYSR